MAIGNAEAEVLQKKVTAVGADSYAAMAMIDNLSRNDMKLVPEILITGGGASGGGASEALLALLASRLVQKDVPVANVWKTVVERVGMKMPEDFQGGLATGIVKELV